MNTQPGLVSVVIPAYNQEHFIAEAIRSVLDQSYSNLQIIVADDHSSDNTLSIAQDLAKKDSRIECLSTNVNLGISKNFNRAFDACKGEYVAFLGGDDIMLPGKIEKQVLFLQQNPDYVLVHHDADIFNSSTGETISRLSDAGKLPAQPLDWAMRIDWFISQKFSGVLPSACLARSEYYLAARYDERLKYKHELLFTIEDYYANPNGKWHVIPEVLLKYRVHDNNFSMDTSNTVLINEETLLMCDFALDKCPGLATHIKAYRNYFIFQRILFGWFDKQQVKKYKKEFRYSAGLVKYYYLIVARFFLKVGLFWQFNKVAKIIYRLLP